MKKRMFYNMLLVNLVTMIILFMTMLGVFYREFYKQMENRIHTEAIYLSSELKSIDSDDEKIEYLSKTSDRTDSRITLIALDGTVMFDSSTDNKLMDNHLERPEIVKALSEGQGDSVRLSTTMREQTYYYAVKLDDDEVVRLAYTSKSVIALVINTIPGVITIFVAILVIVLLWSKRVTNRIVKPVNDIDLKEPDMDSCYDELKPLLLRIKTQNDQRDKNEELRREFSANVSHELKTPLTSISGYSELLENNLVKAEDVNTFARKINDEAQRLLSLIDDIIKLSRIEERKGGIEKQSVDLLETAKEVYETLYPIALKNKVNLVVEGEKCIVNAVPVMMHELIYNLTENAIKYNKTNGSVWVRVLNSDEGSMLQVEDTGIGISKEHQERIFERFYRVDKSHSKKIGGTGLGLAIVKHVAEYQNSVIKVESEEGKGTKITIIL